jgi:DNA-3-methyladenine glycosylase II
MISNVNPMSLIHLFPVPPYDFSLSAAIFSHGDLSIRIFRDGVYQHALDIRGHPLLVKVSSCGTIDDPEIEVMVRPDPGDFAEIMSDVGILISSMFNIYDDLNPFYKTIERDPVMAVIAGKFRGLKSPTTPTVFEALTDSIIEQQISLKVARTLKSRLTKKTGKQLVLDDVVYYCYPEAGTLAETPEDVFRECGLTVRKGEYIREISRSIVAGDLDLDRFRQYEDTREIIREMMKIRGIGKWTAELTIIRGIHKLDAFPADDVGLQRIISRFYCGGRKISSDEVREIANRWGAWKGLAAFYLDTAEHLNLTP